MNMMPSTPRLRLPDFFRQDLAERTEQQRGAVGDGGDDEGDKQSHSLAASFSGLRRAEDESIVDEELAAEHTEEQDAR